MPRFHFISGLPRSGSTLLSALLSQNPRFHASISSPVSGLLKRLQEGMSGASEYSVYISDLQRRRILAAVLEQFYGPEFEAELIFDTSRAWCACMPLLHDLFPESKVIACVRNPAWVVDSIEQLVQSNSLTPSALFKFQTGGTVYSRADAVANAEGLLGYAYNALKEAYFGKHASQLMLVQYDSLTAAPQQTLAAIYAFLGEPAFTHDPLHIEADFEKFDQYLGTPGLHALKPTVKAEARPTLLPPDVFKRFANDDFWRNPEVNPHGVTIV